jgi:hypothetical protein
MALRKSYNRGKVKLKRGRPQLFRRRRRRPPSLSSTSLSTSLASYLFSHRPRVSLAPIHRLPLPSRPLFLSQAMAAKVSFMSYSHHLAYQNGPQPSNIFTGLLRQRRGTATSVPSATTIRRTATRRESESLVSVQYVTLRSRAYRSPFFFHRCQYPQQQPHQHGGGGYGGQPQQGVRLHLSQSVGYDLAEYPCLSLQYYPPQQPQPAYGQPGQYQQGYGQQPQPQQVYVQPNQKASGGGAGAATGCCACLVSLLLSFLQRT